MSFSIISEALDLLDDPQANGARTAGFLKKYGAENITLQTCRGEKGSTDFIRVLIPGKTANPRAAKRRLSALSGALVESALVRTVSASPLTATARSRPSQLRQSFPACIRSATSSRVTSS